eukprot:COSAG01_NODE_904_length_12843_cov_83.351146_1_plen_1333_part_10
MYLKTSSFGNPGDRSYLTSPKLPSGASTMSFYYHMYGKDIGSLAVEAKVGGKWTNGYWLLHTHTITGSSTTQVCNVTLAASVPMLNFWSCKTPLRGQDKCWDRIHWAMTQGISQSPELYPGLGIASNFSDVQCELSQPTSFGGKGRDCEGFTPCNVAAGKCKTVVLPPPPAARNIKLDGHAQLSRCGLTLDGDGDRAIVDNFEYASDGDYAFGFWFSKDNCTSNAWEYMYSHNANAGPIESAQNPGVNVYLACKESYMRTTIVGDKAEVISFDYDVHGAASFSPITARWIHVLTSVSNTGIDFYVDGVLESSSKVTAPYSVYWGMIIVILGAGTDSCTLSKFTKRYLGSTLGTDLHIGASVDAHKDRHIVGTMAGLQVASTSICASTAQSWFVAGHAQLTQLSCIANTWISTGWREKVRGRWTASGWTVSGQQQSDSSDSWIYSEQFALPADTDQVRFVGTTGSGSLGNIAIDTVVLSNAVPTAKQCACLNGVAAVGPACKNQTVDTCMACNPQYSPAANTKLGQANSLCTVASAACAFDIDAGICGWAVQPSVLPPVQGQFERGSDGWTESGKLLWRRGRDTPSIGTGAPRAVAGRFFYFLETSPPSVVGDVSYLNSPKLLSATSMTFYYHMYGATMRTLSVEALVAGTWHTVWSRSGQQQSKQQDAWRSSGTVMLPSGTTQVRFKGVAGRSFTGDMSVDNIVIKQGEGTGVTLPPPSPPSVQGQFEKGRDGWTGSGKLMWRRDTRTPTRSTGATEAASGQYFYFLETSTGRNGDVSYLNSPTLLSPTSMTFYYHMHGWSMRKLSLQALVVRSWRTVWSRTGEQQSKQQDAWRHSGTVKLPSGTTQVRFMGVKGSSYTGDMAIDNIVILVQAVPPLDSGNAANSVNSVQGQFETGSDHWVVTPPPPSRPLVHRGVHGCQWRRRCPACYGDCDRDSDCQPGLRCFQRNDRKPVPGCKPGGGGDINGWDYCYNHQAPWPPQWTRGTRTPSHSTGASRAARGKWFYFLETSFGSISEISYLNSPKLLYATSMTFYYHMYGATMRTLSVEASVAGTWRTVWSRSGQQQSKQQDAWRSSGTVMLPSGATQVRFKGIKGTGNTGDMSVDNIVILGRLLPPPPSVQGQFETGSDHWVVASPPPLPPSRPLVHRGVHGCQWRRRCPACYGDCDRDYDCQPGLRCFQRNDRKPVPGCKPGGGHDINGWDYCYDYQALRPPQWTRSTRAPSYWMTGASKAARGKWFYFLETSFGSISEISYLNSPKLLSATSMTFYYHMYGATMGTLSVEALVAGTWRTVWRKSGQQGNVWRSSGTVMLPSGATQVRFKGIKGTGNTGDMSV